MKKHFSTILLVLVFFVGLSVMLYPTIADYWNSRTQSRAIVDYESVLQSMDQEDYTDMFQAAQQYNEEIRGINFPLMYYDQAQGYETTLDISGTGIMGYLSIPRIGVELPIYHGTSDAVLNVAVGHLEGTSLPIGGESTHSVLSAHRGLPSAKLFTELDKLAVGDTFTITVLDRVLTYEIDQVLIVLPSEVNELYVKEGEDHCTLVTCTPYGINTHRLLVRGTRIETLTEKPPIYITSDAYRIDPIIVTPAVAAPMLLLLLIKYRKKD